MKTLIVYYSLEGNTKMIAEKLAARTGADLLEIKSVKEYPKKGPSKFIVGGKDAAFKVCPEIEKPEKNVKEYDAVVIGSPVWDGTIAPPMRSYLRDTLIKTTNVAAYACMAGRDPKKTFKVIKELVVIDELKAEVSFTSPANGNDPDMETKIDQLAQAVM
ncbi:MAG: NAD(P)H-dependent oxidoreductase [Saccharofermentans sp.]|nr:NAD(P)H-dependent oxidoreductase [Saccharofermentans sp.]